MWACQIVHLSETDLVPTLDHTVPTSYTRRASRHDLANRGLASAGTECLGASPRRNFFLGKHTKLARPVGSLFKSAQAGKGSPNRYEESTQQKGTI